MATKNAKEGTNKKARWKPFMTTFNEWCSDAPHRSGGRSPAGIMAEACKRRGVNTSRKEPLEIMTDALMGRYKNMHEGHLPHLGQRYKMPEMLPAASLCRYAELLVEQIKGRAIKVPGTETALISQLRKVIKYEDTAEINRSVESEPLLAQVVLWEFLYLEGSQRLQSPEEKRRLASLNTPKRVTQHTNPLRTTLNPSPSKSKDREKEEVVASKESSNDEGSLDTDEEGEYDWIKIDYSISQIRDPWKATPKVHAREGRTGLVPPSTPPIQELPLSGRWPFYASLQNEAPSKKEDCVLPPGETSKLLGKSCVRNHKQDKQDEKIQLKSEITKSKPPSQTIKPKDRSDKTMNVEARSNKAKDANTKLFDKFKSTVIKVQQDSPNTSKQVNQPATPLHTLHPPPSKSQDGEEEEEVGPEESSDDEGSLGTDEEGMYDRINIIDGPEGKKSYSLSEKTSGPDVAVDSALRKVQPPNGPPKPGAEKVEEVKSPKVSWVAWQPDKGGLAAIRRQIQEETIWRISVEASREATEVKLTKKAEKVRIPEKQEAESKLAELAEGVTEILTRNLGTKAKVADRYVLVDDQRYDLQINKEEGGKRSRLERKDNQTSKIQAIVNLLEPLRTLSVQLIMKEPYWYLKLKCRRYRANSQHLRRKPRARQKETRLGGSHKAQMKNWLKQVEAIEDDATATVATTEEPTGEKYCPTDPNIEQSGTDAGAREKEAHKGTRTRTVSEKSHVRRFVRSRQRRTTGHRKKRTLKKRRRSHKWGRRRRRAGVPSPLRQRVKTQAGHPRRRPKTRSTSSSIASDRRIKTVKKQSTEAQGPETQPVKTPKSRKANCRPKPAQGVQEIAVATTSMKIFSLGEDDARTTDHKEPRSTIIKVGACNHLNLTTSRSTDIKAKVGVNSSVTAIHNVSGKMTEDCSTTTTERKGPDAPGGEFILDRMYDMGARMQFAKGSWIDNCRLLKTLSTMRFLQQHTPNEDALAPDFVPLWQLVKTRCSTSVETWVQHRHSQYTHLHVECSKMPGGDLLRYYHVPIARQDQGVPTPRQSLCNSVALRPELRDNSASAQALRDWAATRLLGQHNNLEFNHKVLAIDNLVNVEESTLRHSQALPQEYWLRSLSSRLTEAIENKVARVVVAKIGTIDYLKQSNHSLSATTVREQQPYARNNSIPATTVTTVCAKTVCWQQRYAGNNSMPATTVRPQQQYARNNGMPATTVCWQQPYARNNSLPATIVCQHQQYASNNSRCASNNSRLATTVCPQQQYARDNSMPAPTVWPHAGNIGMLATTVCPQQQCARNNSMPATTVCPQQQSAGNNSIPATPVCWQNLLERLDGTIRALRPHPLLSKEEDKALDIELYKQFQTVEDNADLTSPTPEDSPPQVLKASGQNIREDSKTTTVREVKQSVSAQENDYDEHLECPSCKMGRSKSQGDEHNTCTECRNDKSSYPTSRCKTQGTSAGWAEGYNREAPHSTTRRDLVFHAHCTILWFYFELVFNPPSKPTDSGAPSPKACAESPQQMVAALRLLWFKGRASEDSPWPDIEHLSGDKLSAGHMELLKELALQGADHVVTAIPMSPRGDTSLTGENHPPAVRVLDDILTMTSYHGNRSEDNARRIVNIFTQLIGPGGINLIKQGKEGRPQHFKYVFDEPPDKTRRTIRVPGAKLQKVFDLMENFLRKKTLVITCHLTQQVRGVIDTFALCCKLLATPIPPRLDRITANAAIAHPQLTSPTRHFVPTPASLHETDEEAWKAFRFNMNPFFRLAGFVDKDGRQGVWLRSTVEGALPLPSRLVYPGKKTRDWHRVFCSDTAKKLRCGGSMKTGRYVKFPFTQREQLLFNMWNNLDCVTTNHREHLLALFLMILLAPEHPGSIICMLLDNEAAEYAQRRQTTGSRHDEQIMATMAVVALLFGITVYGAKVTTVSNFTDTFTRPDLKCVAEEFMTKFKARTGIKPVKVEILDWLRDMGWEPLGPENPQHLYRFDKILKVIDFLAEHHADTIKKFCPAPVGDIRQMFTEALEGAPIRPIHEFIDDFSPKSGPSQQRVQLTKEPRKTTTTHLRKAQSVGEAEWLRANHIPIGESVLQRIDRLLEKQAQKEIALLEVPNPNYQEKKQFLLPMNVQMNPEWIETREKSRAEVAHSKSCQLRRVRGVNTATVFSGLGAWEKTREGSGHVTIAASAENNPTLHNRLKRMYQEAITLMEIKEYGSSTTLGSRATLFCVSLPCVPPYKADPHRSRYGDKLFESNLKEMIESTKTLGPAIALIECTPGIVKKSGSKHSTTEIIQDCLPGFFSEVMIVKIAEITSSIPDTQNPSYKQSAVLTRYNKAMFSEKPTTSTMGNRAPPLERFAHLLDTTGIYFKSFCQVPQKDQIDPVFKFGKVQGQPAYVGSIRDTPPRTGEDGFKSRVQCPVLGAMGPCTAAGRSNRGAVQCPTQNASANHHNQTSVRQLKPEEVAAIKLIRGLVNPNDRSFMTENPAAAQRMVGNTPSQPLYDAVVIQTLLHLLTVQRGSGQTALEQWEALKPLTVLSTVQGYPPVVNSGALRHQEITKQSSSGHLDNGEKIDITPPFKLIEANVLHIVTPKWNDYVSTRFDATAFIQNPFSELGKRFQQLDCIGCGNRNQFYKESVFCFACTTVLLCYFMDEATYERECIAPKMKDSAYNRELCMLKAVGCHARTYWPWVLNQLIDRNRCTLGRHPLATGHNLERSIQDFAHMRTGSGSKLGLGFNCGSGLGMETEPEWRSVKSEEETYPNPGRTGGGKRELNQQETQPERETRRCRSQTKLTEGQKTAIFKFANEIHLRGKDPGTMTKYASYEHHWMVKFQQMNWHPLFIDCDTEAEKARRTLFYVSYEVKHHGNLSRTVWAKLSGIAWMFIRNYFANPFLDMPALKYFIRHLAGREPKAVEKLPATPARLEYIAIQLDRTTVSGATCVASLLVALWFCARACESFAESENCVDRNRVVYWKDITWREYLGIEARLCSGENISKAEAMTVTLRSRKNALHTCTRTITATPGCEVCAVAAVKNLHAVIFARTRALPSPNEPICQLGPKRWLSRAQVSDILKTTTEVCGCNGKNMTSHSLRRGGTSAYFCAGVPIEDIRIFGRWLSDAYKLYIFLSSTGSIMSKGNVHPTTVTPRFEKN